MMLRQQLWDNPEIQKMEIQYRVAGLPFTPYLDGAIHQATSGIHDPKARDIIETVLNYLADRLNEHIQSRTPRRRIGKIIKALFGAIFGSKKA